MEIATYLEEQNKQRQTIEKQITAQARQMVIDRGMDRDDYRAIVLAGEGWHAGVIGIVASRLVDEFGKPTVLVTFDPADPERMGQGSARSISGFVLDQALACCAKHLTGFGGHAMAAGLKVHRDNFEIVRGGLLRLRRREAPAGGPGQDALTGRGGGPGAW